MDYVFHNQDAIDEDVLTAIHQREKEHANYELNRQNYISILESPEVKALPEVWPEHLVRYKNLFGEALAVVLKGEEYLTVTGLQHRDRVQALLQTTISEQSKTVMVYNALKKRVPDQQRFEVAKKKVQTRIDSGKA